MLVYTATAPALPQKACQAVYPELIPFTEGTGGAK